MPKKTAKAAINAPRVRLLTRRQAKKVAKNKAKKADVPTSFKVVYRSFELWRQHWKALAGVMTVYAVLNIIFASGLSNLITNFSNVKDNLGAGHNLSDALSGFGTLLGGTTSTGSDSASVLQSLLIVLQSLVIIWTLRNLMAGKSFTVKDAYYRSMTPLIPFLLVIFVLIIQLLPLTLGAGLISVISSALNSSGAITAVMLVLLVPLAAWSIYMLTSSTFALYIVTLPDMQPRQALRSAKKLVELRRLKVLRRFIFLPIFMILVMAIVMLPLILFIHLLVVPVYYIMSILALLFIHTYLYSMYRGLLDG